MAWSDSLSTLERGRAAKPTGAPPTEQPNANRVWLDAEVGVRVMRKRGKGRRRLIDTVYPVEHFADGRWETIATYTRCEPSITCAQGFAKGTRARVAELGEIIEAIRAGLSCPFDYGTAAWEALDRLKAFAGGEAL